MPDLSFAGAPTRPPIPAARAPWRETALFAAAVVRGLGVLAATTVARRPFATALAIAFAWGATSILTNLARQTKPHPAPLFARAEAPPPAAPAAAPPPADPIGRLVEERASRVEASSDPRELARAVQTELQRRGFYAGAVDGVVGPGTERAVRQAESRLGLAETGRASEALLARLRAAPIPQPPAARPAPSPAIVLATQRRLAEMGYAPGPADGRMTPAFRRAVERFRRDNDLAPSQAVDAALVDRLVAVTGPLGP